MGIWAVILLSCIRPWVGVASSLRLVILILVSLSEPLVNLLFLKGEMVNFGRVGLRI